MFLLHFHQSIGKFDNLSRSTDALTILSARNTFLTASFKCQVRGRYRVRQEPDEGTLKLGTRVRVQFAGFEIGSNATSWSLFEVLDVCC